MSKKRAPSKETLTRIHEAFDADALIRICESQDFSNYAPRIELEPSKFGDRFYHFQDNGSNILAVAHLDHVQEDGSCQVVDTAAGKLALSGALDDRLGAYVILDLLPKLGITCDWLLTTDEEMGASTAEDFPFDANGDLVTDKDYSWIIQFDRGGTDVVMYDYETPELCALVEASGANVGMGSYSDISCLEHMGCAAFNWGVGYNEYHSPRSHAYLEDTFRMVARFMKFHAVNAEMYLAHDPAPSAYVTDEKWWTYADDEKALDNYTRQSEAQEYDDWLRYKSEEKEADLRLYGTVPSNQGPFDDMTAEAG